MVFSHVLFYSVALAYSLFYIGIVTYINLLTHIGLLTHFDLLACSWLFTYPSQLVHPCLFTRLFILVHLPFDLGLLILGSTFSYSLTHLTHLVSFFIHFIHSFSYIILMFTQFCLCALFRRCLIGCSLILSFYLYSTSLCERIWYLM